MCKALVSCLALGQKGEKRVGPSVRSIALLLPAHRVGKGLALRKREGEARKTFSLFQGRSRLGREKERGARFFSTSSWFSFFSLLRQNISYPLFSVYGSGLCKWNGWIKKSIYPVQAWRLQRWLACLFYSRQNETFEQEKILLRIDCFHLTHCSERKKKMTNVADIIFSFVLFSIFAETPQATQQRYRPCKHNWSTVSTVLFYLSAAH